MALSQQQNLGSHALPELQWKESAIFLADPRPDGDLRYRSKEIVLTIRKCDGSSMVVRNANFKIFRKAWVEVQWSPLERGI